MNDQQMQQSDHDLLVTLVAKVDAFIAGQMAAQNDHEVRIRALEKNDISAQGSQTAKRETSNTTKWLVGTLIAALAVALTAIGMLMANK